MNTIQERDYSISVLRICAMMSIVICHICSHFGKVALGQFFNVGVPIFSLISGYLYGSRKTFSGSWNWLKKRYIRLEMPILAWTAFVTVVAIVRKSGYPTWYQYCFLLLNLQGLNFILPKIPDIFIGPWYFTAIMLCYLLLWGYSECEKKHPNISHFFNRGGVFPLLIFCVCAFMGVSLAQPMMFFIGYTLAKKNFYEGRGNVLLYGSMLQFIVCIVLRLLVRHFLDGTLFYDSIVVPITHAGISICALSAIKWLNARTRIIDKLGHNRLVAHIDGISIYVYISHDWYLGMVPLIDLKLNPLILYPLYAIVVFLTATVLWYVFEIIGKNLEKRIIN